MHQDFCFHIHTARCGHADKKMVDEDTILQFAENGYKSISFTDHSPWKEFLNSYNPGHAMEWNQKEEYFKSIRSLSEKYKDRIEVLAGMEMEYIPQYMDEMKEIVSESDIVVIGEHFTYCDENGYTSLHKSGFVPNEKELDFYANALVSSCEKGFASILAHPDLFMIHKTEFGKKEEEITHRICKAAEKYNVPLEINLCLIAKNRFFESTKITYPCRAFWEIAKNYNIKVLYGLDYHGYFPVKFAETNYNEADEILGKEIISKLNFVDKNQIRRLHS